MTVLVGVIPGTPSGFFQNANALALIVESNQNIISGSTYGGNGTCH